MKRRSFLFNSAIISASLGFPFAANAKNLLSSTNNFGIQLYSVRDEMSKSPLKTLKKLSSFGYKFLEGYEGESGLFWGMSNIEFKKQLDDLGLKMIASHCNETENLESFNKKCAKAAEIGMDYLICPYLDGKREIATFMKHAETFNKCGQIAKTNGIKFAFHNHAYPFEKKEGVYLQDVLMKNTDSNLVDFEMDIYWLIVAGENPIKWFDKHPNRFKYCHLKDYLKLANDEFESCNLGTGSIDFQTIISHGKKRGLETLVVEQEAYRNSSPMQAAKDNLGFMLNLGS